MNTKKLLDLAMRDAEFFSRVREMKGWIFHIEEDKEKEYLVHQAEKEVHDENKKPEIEMLYIFEQENKEIEKAKNAKRNPEFQSEPSISLLTQIKDFYNDSSVHKKYNL